MDHYHSRRCKPLIPYAWGRAYFALAFRGIAQWSARNGGQQGSGFVQGVKTITDCTVTGLVVAILLSLAAILIRSIAALEMYGKISADALDLRRSPPWANRLGEQSKVPLFLERLALLDTIALAAGQQHCEGYDG
jgi:hypothetical protein